MLFHEGDPAVGMHLLAKGRVCTRVTTPAGDVATLELFVPGEVLGEMALLSSDTLRSATAIALEATETLVIGEPTFTDLRRRYPSVTETLVQLLGARVRRLDERLLEALYVPADTRVMRRLLELMNVYGEVVPLTQNDLAGLAGTTRVTVNRVLRREEREGSVLLGRRRVQIVDREAVARRAS